MASSVDDKPSAPPFFQHVHDQFVAQLHEHVYEEWGVEIQNIRNKLSNKSGTESVAAESDQLKQIIKEVEELHNTTTPNINSRRLDKFNKLIQLSSQKQRVDETVEKIKKQDVKESISLLMETKKKIFSGNLTNSNPALSLAQWISYFPIIYYPWGLHSAAIRFKNSLQENAKIHVLAEDIIESSHNGIVAWEKSSKIKPILIIGKDDYIKTKERWQVVKKFFNLNKIQYKEVHSLNGSILTKLVNLIYLLDYSSIYLAVLSKTNPTPVKAIEFIKSRI